MPKFKLSQRFNNGAARNYQNVETDATTLQGLVDLMPNGVSIFQTGQAPAVGTKVTAPTHHKVVEASCFKINPDGSYQSSYVKLPMVDAVKTDEDVVNALIGKIDVPDGTTCDKVNVKKYREVGA